MTRFVLRPLGLAALLTLTTLAGCASKNLTLHERKMWPWPSAAKKYETPEKVIAIWTDAVYQTPGKAPTRGFGGRVYFYNAKGEVIPVDGQLVVYAFDDSDPEARTEKPTRKYAFTSDQLTRYYSESQLGASYNIWIPWDAVGGDEKQIALFPVFVDESGKTVRGTFADNRLPGKRVLTEEERRGFYISRQRRHGAHVVSREESGVKPVGYDAAVTEERTSDQRAKSGLTTHTIHVPRSLSERMANNTLLAPRSPSVTTLPGPTAVSPETSAAPPAATRDHPAATPDQTRGVTSAPPPAGAQPATPYPLPPGLGVGPMPPPTSTPSATTPVTTDQPIPLGQQGFIGADPQYSTSARSHAWARQDSRAAHFARPQFQVPTSPGAQSNPGRAPSPPSLSARQYYHPSPH